MPEPSSETRARPAPTRRLRGAAGRPLLMLAEGPRAALEAGSLVPALPWLGRAAAGDGHSVMVLPGYSAGDLSTQVLRRYLRTLGYRAHPWRQGRNWGLPRPGALRNRLAELHERSGGRVSLVGWSLGGIYARELAHQLPENVRQVITLGSPFRMRRQNPPPVPSTAIFSRSDGVAGWRACREREAAHTDNIEVRASHCGLGFNPVVLYAIADRLAQADQEWKPFDRRGLRRLFYA